jgi:hypothetical protein
VTSAATLVSRATVKARRTMSSQTVDLPGIGTLTIHPHMPPRGGITVYVLDGVLVTKGELRERVAMDNRLDLVLQVK